MEQKLFGTDGIRGRAGDYPLIPEVAQALGSAVVREFGQDKTRPVIIGRDTRESGPVLEEAVAAGAAAAGAEVLLLGVIPTPAIAFLTRHLKGCAGIVISASHNSYEDNGLKIFTGDGLKCDDATEARLTQSILNPWPPTGPNGTIKSWPEAAARYNELALAAYGNDLDLRGFRLVLDTAHGAAYATTPQILRALGAEVLVLNAEPDGKNINAHCGSTHPEEMQQAVRSQGADLGIAHDGDADRLICCDETGTLSDGDEMLAILGLDLLRQKKLTQNTLVATIMSNLGLDECLAAEGGKVLRAGVGDRQVLEMMLNQGLNLGGEQSGHLILREQNTTGDGLVSALALLRIMKKTGAPFSQLRQSLRKYPQLLINLTVRERVPLEELPEIGDTVRAVEADLGGRGRIVLRYSGTELKIRLLVETREEALLQPTADRVLQTLKRLLS